MRKTLALLWLALMLSNASAQAIDPIGGSSSLAPGTTPTGCTALTLFYADSSGKFACMSGTSWDNTNRSLTITGATVTTSKPVLDISQTWNNAAETFKGVLINITNTASSVNSDMFDVQVEGLSIFRVNRLSGVFGSLFTTASQFKLPPNGLINFTDTYIGRGAAASLRLGISDSAAPTAQTLGVQNVVAGTTNANGAAFTIKGSTSTGSGVAGDIIFQTGGTGAGATAQNAFVTGLTIKGASQEVVLAKNATFAEMTAPSAPAANGATLYCDDNGAGKTRCSILFATGAAQQIAIEP